METLGPLTLRIEVEQWRRTTPVRITGYTYDVIHTVLVTLGKDGHLGRGEADVIYYRNEDTAAIAAQVEAMRNRIEAGLSRRRLQDLMPPSSARNAVDCALWDLEAKVTGRRASQIAGLENPRPLITTFTCHADTPQKMAERARRYVAARAIKLKLTGEPIDADRVRAVRAALPDVWLGIDANQGFTRAFLDWIMPILSESRVALIEQPFPVGEEAWLEGLNAPIPIAADESVQSLADIPALRGRFDVVNIKLDKCGGLTEGLAMARAARSQGFGVMVGNMSGTSLAMAPAFLLGQLCDIADLDGPVFLESDRSVPVRYADGLIECPEGLWGWMPGSGVSLPAPSQAD
jgi:L-alanine-DL-glutamate epimerase-like enolase superfamily enzyme